jgi:Mce-associated membrane protein
VTDDIRDVEPTETAEPAEDEASAAGTKLDDSPTEAHATADNPPERTGRGRRGWSRPLRNVKVFPALLVLLLLISAGVTAWVYFEQYRPKQQINAGVAREVVSAASDGTVALLSYSPESLDKDFANAKSHLSGDFLSYYDQFTAQIVAPAAKEKALKTIAHVIGAGVAELHPDSAVVLVFVDQSTTSKDKPDPSMAASSVKVTLTRVNGNWLITKFDPV